MDLNHQDLPTAPGQIFTDDLEYSNINNASHFRRDSRGQWVRRRTGHLARGGKRKQTQLGNTVRTQLLHFYKSSKSAESGYLKRLSNSQTLHRIVFSLKASFSFSAR